GTRNVPCACQSLCLARFSHFRYIQPAFVVPATYLRWVAPYYYQPLPDPVNTPGNITVATGGPPSTEPAPADRRSGMRGALAAAMRFLADSWVWLKWPVAIGILVWMYYSNRDNILKIAATPKIWGFAVLALLLITIANLITFVRWYLLVRAQEFPFRLRDAVRYGFIGVISNYISLGSVGGDLFKAVLLARDQTSRKSV